MKLIIRRIYEEIKISHSTSVDKKRTFVVKVISFVLNQLSSEMFKDMIRYSFKKSGYDGDYPINFQNAIQILFSFRRDFCYKCSSRGFVKCSHCRELLCVNRAINVFYYRD